MKIVLAIDSFKGCLTSIEVENIISNELKNILPNCNISSIPIADGGEGTLSTISQNIKINTHYIYAHDPCMEIIKTQYGISEDGENAFIEMANVSGLTLIKESQKNPMETTSFGTGELIRDALDRGCSNFIIGIGGSATNDAGTGLLQALGFRFYDKKGDLLGHGGKILHEIADIDSSAIHKRLKHAHFTIACDVNNPFCGPNGASYIFAKQKGADENMIQALDKGMLHFAQIIHEKTGKDIKSIPGSGAAGGVGGAMLAFLNCKLKQGAKILLDISGFHKKAINANLIITGEGKIDKQTLMGKIPYHILQEGIKKRIPVIAIAGKVEDKQDLIQAGFKAIYQITPDFMNLEEAIKPEVVTKNIQKVVNNLASTYLKSFI